MKPITPKQELERENTLNKAHYNYSAGLNLYALFKIRNRETSQDLVQETFMKTWVYLVKIGKIDMMKGFLYHVLNNLIIDEYRKRKTVSLDVLLAKGFEPHADDPERLFSILDGKAAALLIERLPKTYRKSMRMRYMQDLTLSEIALITGQSKNTISVQLHRGLAKLKTIYQQQEGTGSK